MTVNHEVKGQLAKLLATEDLVVEHRAIQTAQFNVHTRVLTLPQWKNASNAVYDLLVGHEVGHALYTPDIDWIKDRKIPPQIVNVVEDARIEKMMKRRYGGLSKTFYRGYQQLSEDDFFGIEDEDLNSFNLADKINLCCKIGNHIDIIYFNQKELECLDMVNGCETFDDVLLAAEKIYNYCKNESKESLTDIQLQQNNGQSSSQPQEADSKGGESESQSEISSHGGTKDSVDTGLQGSEGITEEDIGEFDVETMKSFDESLKDLIDDRESFENDYIEIPKVDLNRIIISNTEVYSKVPSEWEEVLDRNPQVFDNVDSHYNEFKKSAQKEVNYLIKEFECRKSASAYARSSVSRTGVLDTSKLHTYKYSEDLFKKVSVFSDGKNHGLVFILDWSGSMADVIVDTLKQLYNLVWFCKKTNIPFDVYAFTSDYPKIKYEMVGDTYKAITPKPAYKEREGVAQVYLQFSLLNLFTSKTRAKELDTQMRTIYRIAEVFDRNYYTSYPVPLGLTLSGTPLNDALICLHEILPKFKRDNNVEKVQCIVLTDGEAPPLKFHKTVQRHWEYEPYLGIRSVGPTSFIRDRKMGTTYSLNGNWQNVTDTLLRHLKDKFSDINFIGMRVIASRDANSFIRRYTGWGDEFDELQRSWRKNRSCVIKNSGYHSYFAISASSLSQEQTFEVEECATKTQIKSAFVKSLKTKKFNKKILNEFVQLIA